MIGDRARRVLTPEEERRLSRRIERGDMDAKREMIERNLGLVHAVARSYTQGGVPFDDLVQEGTVGLIRAVEKFDHHRGFKFSTYAVFWIRRSMVHAISAERAIRIPESAAQHLGAIRRAEDELQRKTSAPANDAVIAEQTGLGVRTVTALRSAAQVTRSLDERVGDDGTRLAELVADGGAVDPSERVGEHESQRQVWRMLSALPQRHRAVIGARYGLDGSEPRTHAEIAKDLGLGEERSRQLEREALHWLREMGGGREHAALAA